VGALGGDERLRVGPDVHDVHGSERFEERRSADIPTGVLGEAVLDRDDYECRFCGMTNAEHEDEHDQGLHAHHVIPRSDGGEDTLSNLLTVCTSCHRTLEQTHAKAVGQMADGKDTAAIDIDDARGFVRTYENHRKDSTQSLNNFLQRNPTFKRYIGGEESDHGTVSVEWPDTLPDEGKILSEREFFYRLGQQDILVAAVDGAKEVFEPIKTVIDDADSRCSSEPGAPIGVIIELAYERGMSGEMVRKEIADLRRRGDLYSPKTDQYKVV